MFYRNSFNRRTGKLREISKDEETDNEKDEDNDDEEPKRIHRIPRGFNLNLTEFEEIVRKKQEESTAVSTKKEPDVVDIIDVEAEDLAKKATLERKMKNMRARASRNRISLQTMRSTSQDPIAEYRLPTRAKPKKTSNKWSQHEHMLAMQGTVSFG